MIHVKDMFYASTNDDSIRLKAQNGGAVTTLLKYALETRMVDAVLAVMKGADMYDGVPTLITRPEEVARSAGSLHTAHINMGKFIAEYLDGAKKMKIAVSVKPCDAKTLTVLAKRGLVNLDNIIMIGLNCGGTTRLIRSRMTVESGSGDMEKIVSEETEGNEKSKRDNCLRCETKIPVMADLACGNWGVIGPRAGKATFVEVCSEKGANLLAGAIKKGILETEPANPKGLDIRGKVEGAMLKLGEKWRKKDFEGLGEGKDRLRKIMTETSRCIKCYQCIDQCPICYCVECTTKNPAMVPPGELPVSFMFHLIRYAHIA